MTTIRTAFGSALSLRHIQSALLRQRPTRRERVLRPRRIGVPGGGILIARGEDIGMLGTLTFFLRQLHEWRATPARGSRHFDMAHSQLGEGGTTPALAAVINAIVDALSEVGVRHIEMPATSGRVWRAIRAAAA